MKRDGLERILFQEFLSLREEAGVQEDDLTLWQGHDLQLFK
jgi:hypothetical protein